MWIRQLYTYARAYVHNIEAPSAEWQNRVQDALRLICTQILERIQSILGALRKFRGTFRSILGALENFRGALGSKTTCFILKVDALFPFPILM